MERERRWQDESVECESQEAGASGNPLRAARLRQRQRARRIDGDELVVERGVSTADGQDTLSDAEAEAAKAKLRQKIRNTERAIAEGVEVALLKTLGASAEGAEDEKQERVIGSVKEPLKERLLEFAKGKALEGGKVRGGGAAARHLREKLGNEGTAMLGKAAGAAAVVGSVKEVLDSVEEAELADFTANTWKGLVEEINRNLPALFDGHLQTVDQMDAQCAVDAASAETTNPWVTRARVAEELERLFNAAELDASLTRGGPLKGRAVFNKVQSVLHHKDRG